MFCRDSVMNSTACIYLVCLHNDENVVDTDSQHQEGDDLNDDEGEGDANVAEDAQRGCH